MCRENVGGCAADFFSVCVAAMPPRKIFTFNFARMRWENACFYHRYIFIAIFPPPVTGEGKAKELRYSGCPEASSETSQVTGLWLRSIWSVGFGPSFYTHTQKTKKGSWSGSSGSASVQSIGFFLRLFGTFQVFCSPAWLRGEDQKT